MFAPATTVRILCVLMLGLFLEGCAHTSGYKNFLNASIIPSTRIPILLYHHVQDMPDTVSASKRRWSVAPKKFEDQMNWIASHGFHPVTMDQFVAHFKQGSELPPKPIILTFDDGWEDQYTTALPILKQHNFVATFFIITNMVGHSAYLNWDQVNEMLKAGMDIQSHTLTHKRLSVLPNDKAWPEIAESKKILETRLNKPVGILAYPYGCYDDDVIVLTKKAGYVAAATVSGLNGGYLLRTDRTYTIDRYAIEWDDNLEGIARWKHFDSN